MGDNEVLRAMTAVRFDTMGAHRSYLDFYMGFGWSITVAMVMQTVLLWQMASLARTNPASVRPMIALIALATVASGVIAWRFIFPVPALFSTALVICSGGSVLRGALVPIGRETNERTARGEWHRHSRSVF